MPDQPRSSRRHVDAVAITLLVIGVFLGAVLLAEPANNTSGLPGLYPSVFGDAPESLRAALGEALGLGLYVLVAGWLVLAIQLLVFPDWLAWFRCVVGWLVLVVCAAVAADRAGSTVVAGPAPGSGGAMGAVLALWLQTVFDPIMSHLIFGTALLVGLTLAAERVVTVTARASYHVVRRGGLALWGLARIAARLVGGARRGGKQARWHEAAGEPPKTNRQPVDAGQRTGGAIRHSDNPSAAPTGVAIDPAPAVAVRNAKTPAAGFALPALSLLDDAEPFPFDKHDGKLRAIATQLEKTFKDFGLTVRVVGIHSGPVITQYEIALETGLRVAKVTALGDDLALALKVPSVRIVAPLPGRNTVGVEVPNEHRAVVRLKELVTASASKIAKAKLPLFLGKDSEGHPLVYDLADMPHLLIAGRTGTGKSVCLNSIILSLLLTRSPDECRLLMIDPKQVELAEYAKIPHLMHPVVTDNAKAEAILAWAVDKMEERYEVLRRSRVRNIASYNDLPHGEILRRARPGEAEADRFPPRMPHIVIVVDEVGDLMMAMKKEVEGHIIRLAQKSRASAIHLILTTQRPTVDVITGLIKSNLPARICFQVADRSNSRVVLDEMGAEKLLGKGDMLFLQPSTSTIVRAQGTYASDDEIIRVVGHLEVEAPDFDSELMHLEGKADATDSGDRLERLRKRDELYEQAIEIVVREGRGSVSLLQRALGIGYGRAARLIDFMAEDGIVGHYNGAQAREVLLTPEQWEQLRKADNDSDLAASA